MEATNSKRRGFLKSKLVKPLSRLAKPFPLAHGGGSKVKPSPPAAQDSPDGYYWTGRKSMSNLPSTPPVQIASVAKANHVLGSSVGYTQQSSYHGDDENVDLKAESYINNVRKRFRSLEGAGFDQAHHPEML